MPITGAMADGIHVDEPGDYAENIDFLMGCTRIPPVLGSTCTMKDMDQSIFLYTASVVRKTAREDKFASIRKLKTSDQTKELVVRSFVKNDLSFVLSSYYF